MIKFKAGDIESIISALDRLDHDVALGFALAYRLLRIRKRLAEEWQTLLEKRVEIGKVHGRAVAGNPDQRKLDEEGKKEILDLNKTEIEVEIEPIPLSLIVEKLDQDEQKALTNILAGLEPILVMDLDEPDLPKPGGNRETRRKRGGAAG